MEQMLFAGIHAPSSSSEKGCSGSSTSLQRAFLGFYEKEGCSDKKWRVHGENLLDPSLGVFMGPTRSKKLVSHGLNINWAEQAHKHKLERERERNIGGDVMTERPARKRKMEDTKETKPAPKWPLIKPKKNLHITPLRDFDLFTVQNFFSSAESKAFVKVAEAVGFAHQGSLGPTKGEAFRDNDRISVNDPVLADTIWDSGLNKLFSDIKIRGKVAVGLNPNIRLYRYKVGQRFGRHIDESVNLGDGKRTYYTLLVYLSGGPGEFKSKSKNEAKHDPSNPSVSSVDPLVGGETVFYGPRNSTVAEVAPTEGTALLHLHGDKCLLHEARNVTKGVKYVFRSDVVFA